MKRFIILLFALFLFCTDTSMAQDIHFSQFYDNAVLRNPALTGIFSGDYKAGVNYRSQWAGISVPYQTVMATFEARIPIGKEDVKDYVSFGLAATYDRAGSVGFNTAQIYPSINYNKSLDDEHNTYFSVGFTGGYIQRSIDISKGKFSSQYVNGGYSGGNPTGEHGTFKDIQSYDLGAGVSFNGSMGPSKRANYYVGISAYHILQPRQAFLSSDNTARTTAKESLQLGFKFRMADQFALTTHFNYTIQYPFMETIGGGLVSWRTPITKNAESFTVYAGAFYRLSDAIIPTFKVEYQNYSVNLSYDVTVSKLSNINSTAGGFEISLFTRGVFSKEETGADAVRCPHFEVLDEE